MTFLIENIQRTDTIEFLFSNMAFAFANFTDIVLCVSVLLVSTQGDYMFKRVFLSAGELKRRPSAKVSL